MNRRVNKRTVLVGICVLLLAACESDEVTERDRAEIEPDRPDCQLVLGWDPWEPYHYVDPLGQVQGLDIEIIEAAARRAGCGLHFEQGDWVTLLDMVQEGGIDFLPGATRTAARETYAHFSDPYRSERFALFGRSVESDSMDGRHLESLLAAGKRIGVTEGYIYGEEVEALRDREEYADQFVTARIAELNMLRLVDGEIDAFLEDIYVASSILRRMGLSDQVEELPLQVELGEVHLMFSRVSVEEDLVKRLNAALTEIAEDGTIDRIVARYRP
jgi:polar amino acid transport system substrate-binding protein